MPLAREAARWFETRRGIKPETLEAFGLTSGEDEPDLIVIPYPDGMTKFRKGFEKSDGRRFWWTDAAGNRTTPGQVPFLVPGFDADASQLIVFEGETDTMAAWQAATDTWKPNILGLSGTDAWKDEYAEKLFGKAKRVFFVTDNDDPYESPDAAESVERGWRKVKASLGRKARRVRLPAGVNDAAEFFEQYDWAAFHVLLRKASEPVRYYPRLDLSKPVPDTDWVVEDLVVAGEATVLAADGGVGKSFLMQALALAVSGGEEKFLGLSIKKHGPVIYVDEENSRALAHQRLRALGFDAKTHKTLEYIWYAGVDLLNEPEKLREEAEEIEPALVIVDSLSRVSIGAEENNNDDMTLLMKLGVVPIARETNAGVIVVHHTAKDGRGSRGAGAIRNAADQEISVIKAVDKRGNETGILNIFPSKPRRQTAHIHAQIVGDVEKGEARVIQPDEEVGF